MRVLLVHNRYRLAGGEDVAFEAEARLLVAKGHQVVRHIVDNQDLDRMAGWAASAKTLWNRTSYAAIRDLCTRERPDVAHFHNTFPLISPSAYYAAKRSGVPVVQTLHNYRLICPNALLFRDGRPCEDCVGRLLSPSGWIHRCYRGSRSATGVAAAMLALHRSRRTYQRQVDAYIALTTFAKGKFVEGGLPEAKIHVKPNFLDADPGEGSGDGGYAVYVGRLAPEKGLRTLLAAWQQVGTAVPLRVIGSGPEEEGLRSAGSGIAGIDFVGAQSRQQALEAMKGAAMLVMPSECYEGVPLALIEALAVGTPIVGSRHGSFPSLIEDGRTGALFEPANASALAETVRVLARDKAGLAAMRAACRTSYLERFSAEVSYAKTMAIYEAARAT